MESSSERNDTGGVLMSSKGYVVLTPATVAVRVRSNSRLELVTKLHTMAGAAMPKPVVGTVTVLPRETAALVTATQLCTCELRVNLSSASSRENVPDGANVTEIVYCDGITVASSSSGKAGTCAGT